MTDIDRAFHEISEKRTAIDLLYRYYDGPQPLKYSTQRLREAFDDITTHFEINWATVVVDSTLDRLGLTGFDAHDDIANAALSMLFDGLHIDIEAAKAHEAALVATEGYVIAWAGQSGTELYYNDPRMCEVFYSSEHPNTKTFAAKWFVLDDGRQEITLYYPDRLEHWRTDKPEREVRSAGAFKLRETDANIYGEIPVFCLQSPGELQKITTLQDAINKLFSDMMVSAEFGAYVQRYVISQSDPGELKNGPNQIWWLPTGDGVGQSASVGQFTPTSLNGYLDAMDKLANAIAIITRTPKHYLMTTGANVSGEALLAMENPLVRKVKTRRRVLSASWQDIAAFLLKLQGIIIPPASITVTWERSESVQPKTEAETRKLDIESGIALRVLLKKEGWTEREIEENDEAISEQKAGMASDIGSALMDAQRKLDRTNAQAVDDGSASA